MSSTYLEPLHPAPPKIPGRWFVVLGRLEIALFVLWALWSIVTPPDLSSVAVMLMMVALWGMVGVVAFYHLVRSPELRASALVYLLVPVLIFTSIIVISRSVELPLANPALLPIVIAGALFFTAGRVIFKRMAAGNWSFYSSRGFNRALVALLACLNIVWILIASQLMGSAAAASVIREQEWLIVLAFFAFLTSVPTILITAFYALGGMFVSGGRAHRSLFFVQLAGMALLIAVMVMPSFVLFINLISVG